MQLYMISLGGKAPGANLEVHDLQFVVASSVEACIQPLKDKWYGLPLKLHMDSYKEIIGADGYAIELKKTPYLGQEKLYFVHVGGYEKEVCQEIHGIGLMVGTSITSVKAKAPSIYNIAKESLHVDNVVAVQEVLITTEESPWYIHLEKAQTDYDLKPDWFGYRRLDE